MAVTRHVTAADGAEPLSASAQQEFDEILARAAASTEAHRKGDVLIRLTNADGTALDKVTVQVEQTGHDFLFGCILFDLVNARDTESASLFRQRFLDLFNFAVLPFYWASYEQQPGQTNEQANRVVADWCREQGIVTKGHPLVWTNEAGVPRWLRGKDLAERDALSDARVQREVSLFAGTIDIWDVVNEPVNTRAWDDMEGSDYQSAPIDRIADYVERSLRVAHQANPQATLILNEFNLIPIPETRQRFASLISEMQRRGAPLHGLGIQAHEPRQEWYAPQAVWTTLEELASFGLPLHLTELIPQSSGKTITGPWRQGQWDEQAQADFAEMLYRLAFAHPAVKSVNWWGLSDERIWLPQGGLVDAQYRPKLVYQRLKQIIHEKWKTRLSLTTAADGTVGMRGFYGPYRVTVARPTGEPITFSVQLKREESLVWSLQLPDTK